MFLWTGSCQPPSLTVLAQLEYGAGLSLRSVAPTHSTLGSCNVAGHNRRCLALVLDPASVHLIQETCVPCPASAHPFIGTRLKHSMVQRNQASSWWQDILSPALHMAHSYNQVSRGGLDPAPHCLVHRTRAWPEASTDKSESGLKTTSAKPTTALSGRINERRSLTQGTGALRGILLQQRGYKNWECFVPFRGLCHPAPPAGSPPAL
jgi:hypothetical protein